MTPDQRARIRALNDRLRQDHRGGRMFMTSGVLALGGGRITEALEAIASFDDFGASNDPYGEHDFGCVKVGTESVFWKIDYYDQSLTCQAVDPADAEQCVRVMTVMLAREY